MKLPILMYHYVRPKSERMSERHYVLDLELFDQQLDVMAKKYEFVLGNDLLSLDKDSSLHENKIWLTFDDGYRDCIDHVLPALLKVDAVATFYVPTEAIYGRKLLDVNKIHILLSTNIKELDLVEITKRNFNDLKIDEAIEQSFDELFEVNAIANAWNDKETEFLKKIFQKLLPRGLRRELLDRVFRQMVEREESSWVDEFYLTPDDVRKLADSGMEIGSHGHSHEWLAEVNAGQQREDLVTSFLILDSELGSTRTRSVSYPFGSYDKSTLEILKEFDIHTAVVNKGQKFAEVTPGQTSMLELDRIDIMFFDQLMRGDFF